jgi:hypothetical protein
MIALPDDRLVSGRQEAMTCDMSEDAKAIEPEASAGLPAVDCAAAYIESILSRALN